MPHVDAASCTFRYLPIMTSQSGPPPPPPFAVDPLSGFSPSTRIFRSLHQPISFPPHSIIHYVFSILPNSATAALIDAATRRRIPFSDLPGLVHALSSNLRRQFHLSKNDVAFVLSPNSVHVPVLYLSLMSLGVVVTPVNPLSSDSEISRQIRLSHPVIAFVTSETVSKVPSLQKGSVVLDSTEFESFLVPPVDEERVSPVEVFPNDTAAILYSSGTSGITKGVALTHRNFVAAIAGSRALRATRPSPAVILCTVPFFHVYGFLVCIREVALGGTIVVAAGKGLASILETVEDFSVTHLALAPPTVAEMVKNPSAESHDLKSLEVVLCGGATLPSYVIEKLKIKFPNVSLLQAYGLTETTGGITRVVGGSETRAVGSIGRLMPNCEAKIVDPTTGHAQPPLNPGELWLRGPLVMKGYVGDKEATAATINLEGWLRTGDICYFNNEGHLFFVDRMKELIKYKGYQVAPAELEDVLQSHPSIVDAAVIPYPDEDAGQIPVAFVVRQPGSTVNDLHVMDFVTQQVAPYKRIRRVFFIDSIPKNAPGKVLRKELIKLALGTASKL